MRRCLLLSLPLVLVVVPAHAEKARVWGHMASKHLNGGDYNEYNPGLGIELSPTEMVELDVPSWVDNVHVEVGFYRNSFKQRTTYVNTMVRLVGSNESDWEFGVGTMNVHGYDDIDPEKVHAPIPYVRYKRVRMLIMGSVLGFSANILTW